MKHRIPVKLHQLYQSKYSGMIVEIIGKSNSKWKARVITDDPTKFGGSHTLSEITLLKRFRIYTPPELSHDTPTN